MYKTRSFILSAHSIGAVYKAINEAPNGVQVILQEVKSMPRTTNMAAFLDMIAISEGTAKLGNDNGYNVLVGGTLFNGYADHPRKLVKLNDNLSSTAAGRYQLLSRYFDVYKKQLHLPDFSPESQDAIAIQQIKECKAVSDIEAGRITDAIKKCAHIWASLPGANYGQHENSIAKLEDVYRESGGQMWNG